MASDIVELYAGTIGLLQRYGYRIRLCPLQMYKDRFDDLALCRQIAGRAGAKCEVQTEVPSEHRFAELCRQSAMVLTGRLHGSVLAARCGVPFVSVAYSHKQPAFHELCDIADLCVPCNEATAARLAELCVEAIASRESLVAKLRERVEVLRRLTEIQLEQIKRWSDRPTRSVPNLITVDESLQTIGPLPAMQAN